MSFPQRTWNQFISLFPHLLVYLSLPLIILASIGLVAFLTDTPVQKFTQDTIVVIGGHPFAGALSNLGILIWSAATAICFFSFFLIKDHMGLFKGFLFGSGCITIFLMLDDLFLFHERYFPVYIGLPERLVYVLYIFTILTYLFWFRKIILQSDYVILLLACGCFAGSILIDQVFPPEGNFFFLTEDGLKFLGISCWCFYFYRVCKKELLKHLV